MQNKKHVAQTYKPEDLVLVKNEWKNKYDNDMYQGWCTIITFNNNGTVNIKRWSSATQKHTSICNLWWSLDMGGVQ